MRFGGTVEWDQPADDCPWQEPVFHPDRISKIDMCSALETWRRTVLWREREGRVVFCRPCFGWHIIVDTAPAHDFGWRPKRWR